MKKLFLALLITFTSVASAQKIGTIDMDQTFLKYYKTINAEKSLKKQVRIMEDRAVEMENQYKQTITEYEKLNSESLNVMLKEETRKKKKEEAKAKQGDIRMMERAIQSFNKDAKDMLAKQHNQSRQDILKEIQKVINMIAKNKGLDLVLDKSGKTSNLIPSVVYSADSMEITEEVLNILNKGHEEEVANWEKERKEKAEKRKAEAAAKAKKEK